MTDCETCKHKNKAWDELPCDSCSDAHSGYEPKKCCANCKWIDTDPYDGGPVCVNSSSSYCADDGCDEWEIDDGKETC